MKPFYLTLFICCILQAAHAQTKRQVKLTDSSTQKPIPFATIALFKTNDAGKPVQQLISKEDGVFEISVKDTTSYELLITHTSYRERRLPFSGTLPAVLWLVPASDTTGSVIVTGTRKALIEKVEDKMVYNVEADVTMDGQTATDALRKAPFVSVDGDGNIQLKGQSNYRILLNGKEAGIFAKDPKEALKSFPAGSIKKIEIIPSPSAKYDAEGTGGIINIITKKQVSGYNASLGSSYRTLRNLQNGSLNIKYGKWGFTGSASRGHGKNRDFTTQSVTEALVPSTYSKRILDGTGNNQYHWWDISTEISYDIDSLHTVSGYINGGNNPFSRWQTREVAVINPEYSDTAYSTFRETAEFPYVYNDQGMDFIKKFAGKPNKEWSVKLNRQYSGSNSYNNNDQMSETERKQIKNNNQEKNTQYVLQSDFVLPLPAKQKLEIGAKGIFRNASAVYEAMYKDKSDKYVTDAANSDRFSYRQDVYSAYLIYNKAIGSLNLKLGGRLENTQVSGTFKTSGESLHQNYYNFIPTFYLSRKYKESHDFSLSYTKRLRRPFIWDLNPFVNNIDTLNISYGNPNLKPEVTHVVSLSYSYFKNSNSLSISLSQNLCNTQIVKYTVFDAATGVAAMIPDNIGENRFTSLSLSLNLKPVSFWTMNLNAGVQYNNLRNKFNPAQHNKGFSGNGNLSNTFDITKKFSFFNSGGFWQSPVQLQGKFPFNYWYDAGFAHKLLNNKLRITVRANNFLQEYMTYRRKFADKNFVQDVTNRFRQRTIDVSVRWNFGKLSESTSRKRGVKTDDIQK